MVVSNLKIVLLSALVFTTFEANSAVNTEEINIQNNNQLVNLNFQISSKNKMVKSELMMPFNQTAELERKFGNKNILVFSS